MTRFCLSRLKLSPGPVLIFSSGGNREGCNHRSSDGPGRTDDRLTDWLTDWRTVMPCLRLHYDWVSNLIAYTNFIYVTWVHFVPPSVHRGMKVSSFPEEDRKWSVAICNAFSRFSIGNVWINDAIGESLRNCGRRVSKEKSPYTLKTFCFYISLNGISISNNNKAFFFNA